MACMNCGRELEAGVYICDKCVEKTHSRHRIGSSIAMSSSILNDINLSGSVMLGVDQSITQEGMNLIDILASEKRYLEELAFRIEDITEDNGKRLLALFVRMLINIGLPLDIEEKPLPLITESDLPLAGMALKVTEELEAKFPVLSDIENFLLIGNLHYTLSRPDSGVILMAGREHHLNKAGEYYDKALSNDQTSVPAWKNKAKVLLEKGEYKKAMEIFDWILGNLELPDDDITVVLNKGIALYESGNFEEAADSFDKVLDKNPANVEAWRRKGDILAKTERWGGAIQCYNEALKHDQSREDIRIAIAHTYLNHGKYKEVSRCIDEVLKNNIRNIDGWYLQGIVFSEIGRWGAAVQCFDRALSINSTHIKSLKAKGDILVESKRYDYALECYESALKLQPGNFELLHSKVKILKSMKRYKDALQTLEEVVKTEEDNADAWFEMGEILQFMGKVYKAMESFDKALELRPSLVEAYYKKGQALESLKRYKEALRCYEKALKLDPKLEKALRAKTNCLLRIKGK